MVIKVLTFAGLAEAQEADEIRIELSDNATAADAIDVLARRWPKLDRMRDAIAIAVNHDYVAADHELRNGDELALIPPVSGG